MSGPVGPVRHGDHMTDFWWDIADGLDNAWRLFLRFAHILGRLVERATS